MRIYNRSFIPAGLAAMPIAAIVLHALIHGANARDQAHGSSGTISSHIQNTSHLSVAKNDHDHDHGHKHRLRLSRLFDHPAYCSCNDESCPEWVLVRHVPNKPTYVLVRHAKLDPRCNPPGPLWTDPNYD